MKIQSIIDQGSGVVNEDVLLIKENTFGVFDGATSLVKYQNEKGETGGFIASRIAKETFEKNNKYFTELAIEANGKLREEMIKANVNIDKKENLWITGLAVVKIHENTFDWIQISDCLILVIYDDDSYKLLVKDYNHDLSTLLLCQELAKKQVKDFWKNDEFLEQSAEIRKNMNVTYGFLNGEHKAITFLKGGVENLKNIKHILLFTDGLILPKKDPKEKDDFDTFVKLFIEGGLEKIKNHIRKTEDSDPYCWEYPRFKQYDDIAAISITF